MTACFWAVSGFFIFNCLTSLALGMNLAPASLSPTIAVGDETREVITVHNPYSHELTIRVHADQPAGADPRIMVWPDLEDLVLKSGESADVAINIHVPAGLEAGRTRTVIRFDAAPRSGSNVAIIGQVAVPVEIEAINPIDQVDWFTPLLVDSAEPAVFGVRARNSGNNTVSLREIVRISGLRDADYLEAEAGAVKVGEYGLAEAVWEDVPFLAVRLATVSVSSGVGAPIEKKILVVAFPFRIFLAVAGMTAVLAVGGLLYVRGGRMFRRAVRT